MSHCLEQLLDAETRAECERNDAAMTRRMRAFRVLIGCRDCPRVVLEVMAPDSFAASVQHMDLAQPGERMEVTAL